MAKKKVRKQIKKQSKKSKSKSKPEGSRVKSKTTISQNISITTTIETSLPSTGSYYIRSIQKGKSFNLYLKQYKDGMPITPHSQISPAVYYRFGLSSDMTAIDAQAKLNDFRKMNKATRLDISRQDRAFKRFAKSRTINQGLFPPDLVSMFEHKIKSENFGSPNHLKKKLYIFSTVQEIITSMKISPELYAENTKSIFKHFANKKYSLNYCQKLISMMNDWGKFATSRGSGYYKVIPQPKGQPREKIHKESKDKTGVRKEAIPMTQNLFDQIKSVGPNHGFTTQEINFFKATFFLGLRPEELIKTASGGKHFSKYTDMKSGFEVVSIYQEKLQGVPDNKKTKHIPIKYTEQVEAIKIIESQNYQKPTYKKIRQLAKVLKCNFENRALGLYSGRKGFANWCFDKGETSFESVASWLGHLDTKTTFAIYRDRTKVMAGNSETGNVPKVSGF